MTTTVLDRTRLTAKDVQQLASLRGMLADDTILAQLVNGLLDDSILVLPKEGHLSPAEAAKVLGVSRPYVTGMIKSGVLEAHMEGNRHRIPISAIVEYVRKRDEGRRLYAEATNAGAKDKAAYVDSVAPISDEAKRRMTDLFESEMDGE